MGAVHDLASLAISAKNEGRSIADLTENILDRNAKIVFSLFVFLTLILIVAVFAAIAGQTLANTPEVVLPTLGLIPVASLIGWLMYHRGFSILLSSLLGVAMLFGLIVLGHSHPLSLPVSNPAQWWTIILIIYGMIASVTPVTLLLQPRDHLAALVLFAGMFFGFLGLLLSRPELHAPPVVSFSSDQGWMFPMLFITIGCGAVSGFHSLVASGTTAKQLPTMKDIRAVGYGAWSLNLLLLFWQLLPLQQASTGKRFRLVSTGSFIRRCFRRGMDKDLRPRLW